MINLLQETKDCIECIEKSINDIIYIGDLEGNCCTWQEFEVMSDFDYNDGYGGAEVLTDLVIIFNNGTWLERGEYDGSEWWDCKKCPEVLNNGTLTKLFR